MIYGTRLTTHDCRKKRRGEWGMGRVGDAESGDGGRRKR
jgi:hypothetical protein